MAEVSNGSGIEKESNGGVLDRFRESRLAKGVALGAAVVGAVGLTARGYTNAVVGSQLDVAQLSNRTEAAVFESHDSGEPGSIELHEKNVLFTEGAEFYTAPLELEDSRFFGLVNTDNHVATLGSDDVLLADSGSFTINGAGNDVWVGVRPANGELHADGEVVRLEDITLAKEVSPETDSEQGSAANDQDVDGNDNNIEDATEEGSQSSQSSQFELSDFVWARANINEETGLPTIYYADTDQGMIDASIESITVSADRVTVTGRNIGRIAVSEDVSDSLGSGASIHEVLDFITRFIGSEDDNLVGDMSRLRQ